MRMSPDVVVKSFLAVAFGISISNAGAVTLCVTDAATLQKALTDLSDSGMYSGLNPSSTIYVVKGKYKTTDLPTVNAHFVYTSTVAQSLYIAGSYQGACPSPVFKADATLSVLDGDNATPVLELHSAIGNVQVSFLTIQNGKTGGNPAGLSINAHIGDNGGVTVNDNIIQNNDSAGLDGGLFIASGGTNLLQLQSNLILNNNADNGYGAGEVVGNGGQAGVYANTVYGNTSSLAGSVGGLSCSTTNHGSVIDNIFWNNTNFGLNLATPGIYVSYNDVDNLKNPLLAESITGDVSVAPQFVNTAGDFHLKRNSPLLAMSPLSEGSLDLDGNSYPQHGKVDLGAYEETIFIDGVDGD